MGKHTASQDLQAKADAFDDQFDVSTQQAGANAPSRDERIEQMKASNGEHFRRYRRN